ncbi:MAG: beta-propeller domain-containing protein [Kineosporiaceae bacterium]
MRPVARSLTLGIAVTTALAGVGVLVARGDGPGADAPALSAVASVQSFDGCDDLLRYIRGKAEAMVGPYGLDDGAMRVMAARETAADAGATSGAGASAPTAAPVQQVEGVAEGDVMAMTASGLMVSVLQEVMTPTSTDAVTVLRVARLDAATRKAVVVGSLRLPQLFDAKVLVSSTRAVVVGLAGGAPVERQPGVSGSSGGASGSSESSTGATVVLPTPGVGATGRMIEVDLAEAARPRAVRALDVDGAVVQARAVGSAVRVVVTRPAASLPWVYPSGDGDEARDRATATNRALVRESSLDAWVPKATEREIGPDGRPSGPARTTRLLDCSALAAPSVFAGLDTVSLVSADLAAGGLAQWDAAGLLASGSTVYATARTTYVTSTRWQAPNARIMMLPGGRRPASSTQIHAFTTDPAAGAGGTRYLASGEVPGSLLSQWAMDEHDGVLRVASSLSIGGMVMPLEGDAAASSGVVGPKRAPKDENRVTVLRRDGDRLREVGRVSGFGHDETIRGVRFLGDVGYVVTYRQTDPLYTLDLRVPERPAVVGELKILGYSSFLQPMGEGRLLGVGRSGDEKGATTGVQVVLFDVSDPARPRALTQAGVLGAWSDIEGDHHAFSVGDGLALAPYSRWSDLPQKSVASDGSAVPQTSEFDAGVLAVRVDGDRLDTHLLRPISDGPTQVRTDVDTSQVLALNATPLRTVVTDGVVWTLTAAGIAAHDATSFERVGFVRF